MSDTDDLKELVQKAAAGDKTAFEELYQETCRSVYFTCFGFLKDEQEAQDVTQEVYLTAFEQLDTLENADKFKTWLYRVATNKSINCLKKKQPSLPGDEQLEDMETEDNENFLPEEYALNADKREVVLKVVRETCSDVLYQTILLHYFNEFSIAEIAEIMECPEGTVKYRLSVARAKIKEGVLRYEKKSGDKLYSVAVLPFLTALFTAQMQDMQMPSLPLSFLGLGARPKSTLAAQTAKTGGRIMLKGLQLKIAVGIAAVVLIGGVAAAVIITNHNAQEASAGVQGESTLDVADAGNAEDMDTSLESDASSTNELNNSDTLESTSKSTPETTPEPTRDPFAEENGFSMGNYEPSEDNFGFSLAYYLGENGEAMTESDEFEITNRGILEAYPDLPYPSIYRSETDADGNVTYTISVWYNYEVSVSTASLDIVTQNLNIESRNWGLFDYYTGTYLSPKENTSEQLDIIWGDTTYHINCTQTTALNWNEWSHFEPSGNEVYDVTTDYFKNLWTNYCEVVLNYEITVPADYDGLVLFCRMPDDRDEVYEYVYEFSIEDKMNYVQGYDTDLAFGAEVEIEDTSNYTFMRVSDIIYVP